MQLGDVSSVPKKAKLSRKLTRRPLMSDVTFLIGNGFDLNVGLRTSANQFCDWFIKQPHNDVDKKFQPCIAPLKQDMEMHTGTWADLESAFGAYSKRFGTDSDAEEGYLACHTHVLGKLREYLRLQTDDIVWDKTNSTDIFKFVSSLLGVYNYVDADYKESVLNTFSMGATINYLQFNYTNTFDELLRLACIKDEGIIPEYRKNEFKIPAYRNTITHIGKNIHLHGQIEPDNAFAFGVARAYQIKNPFLQNNIKVINHVVKPTYLNRIPKAYPRAHNHTAEALDVIKRSNLLCIFGSSIGATDRHWWEHIGEWLQKDLRRRLVIFDRADEVKYEAPSGQKRDAAVIDNLTKAEEETKKNIKKRICTLRKNLADHVGTTNKEISTNKKQIIIQINKHIGESAMFGFKLHKKPKHHKE
jgi:hypothetical protein